RSALRASSLSWFLLLFWRSVEPIDQIAQRVVAGAVQCRFFAFLDKMQQEYQNSALDQRDHRAIETDSERFGYLVQIERLVRVACRRERRTQRIHCADESERRYHPGNETHQPVTHFHTVAH